MAWKDHIENGWANVSMYMHKNEMFIALHSAHRESIQCEKKETHDKNGKSTQQKIYPNQNTARANERKKEMKSKEKNELHIEAKVKFNNASFERARTKLKSHQPFKNRLYNFVD